MIIINKPRFTIAYEHVLTCTKSIGTFKEGKTYNVKIMKCHKEQRYMVFTWNEYCIGEKPLLDTHFDEQVID